MTEKTPEQLFDEHHNSGHYREVRTVMTLKYPRLNDEEIIACMDYALFEVVRVHNFDAYPSIRHSLLRYANFRCLDELRVQAKYSGGQILVEEASPSIPSISEYYGCLTTKQQALMVQRFELDMTYVEIGHANGYSREHARQLTIKAVDTIRESVFDDENGV